MSLSSSATAVQQSVRKVSSSEVSSSKETSADTATSGVTIPLSTMQKSEWKESSTVSSYEASSAHTATPSISITPSRSTYHMATIDVKASYRPPETPEIASWTFNSVYSTTNWSSLSYDVGSSSLYYPHVTTPSEHAVVTSTLSIKGKRYFR